jgi:apolipoprotein N-acyltransferase
LAAIGPGRTTTYNSLAETIVLAAQVKTGQVAAPDFVLWPESSVAQDPETDLVTASLITTASQIIEAPLLVGAISRSPEAGYRYTTALWWMPDGQVVSHYEKQNIVPFGEWVPLRSLLEPLFPELELVGLQTQAGPGPGIVLGQLTDGRVLPVGVLICFEVGYDDTVDEMLRGAGDLPPAQVTVVQTNNSALTGTGQMAQQDAISQIRALESRRDVVIATTNSLSGWISPDGQHQWQATPERSAATTVTVSLRTGLTPAIAYRQPIEVALVLISVLISGWLTFRHRRSRTQTSTGSSPAVQE